MDWAVWIPALVWAAYGSLAIELLFFPIPSEASTLQLFRRADPDGNDGGPTPTDPLSGERGRSAGDKLLRYFLPTAFGVLCFALPALLLLWPPLEGFVGALPGFDHPAAHWAGLGLLVGGRALTFGSVLQLRRRRRGVDYSLQPAGIFRRSRNPGLVGMYAYYLGLLLWFPSLLMLIGFFPYVLNMHQRVLLEERHLSGVLGAEYERYRASVPRYLGWR